MGNRIFLLKTECRSQAHTGPRMPFRPVSTLILSRLKQTFQFLISRFAGMPVFPYGLREIAFKSFCAVSDGDPGNGAWMAMASHSLWLLNGQQADCRAAGDSLFGWGVVERGKRWGDDQAWAHTGSRRRGVLCAFCGISTCIPRPNRDFPP